MSWDGFAIGDQVRVRDDVDSVFAGRDGIVTAVRDAGGYLVTIGIASGLWFEHSELQRRPAEGSA